MLLLTNENHTATLRSGILSLAGEACTVTVLLAILDAKIQKYFYI